LLFFGLRRLFPGEKRRQFRAMHRSVMTLSQGARNLKTPI